MGAFGMMNLLHKLLALLAIEWKLAIMHALLQGESSLTRASSFINDEVEYVYLLCPTFARNSLRRLLFIP